MIRTLPRWVEYGAFILAFVAGCINAIAVLGFEQQAVSHLSGTVTLLGIGLFNPSIDIFHITFVVISFFIGAALSGFLVHSSNLKLGRHYGVALFIEALLLFVSIYLLVNGSLYGHYLTSAACGLQNALATSYSGAVIRTTHLTGIFTDLGLMLGAKFRGEAFDKRKSVLFILIISGFILGASLGSSLFYAIQFIALAVPASICLILSLAYRIYTLKATKVVKKLHEGSL